MPSTTRLSADEPVSLDDRLTREWRATVKPLLQQHCGDCHMDSANEGGVNLEDYQDLEKIRQHASTWEQIRGVVRADAMPPPDSSSMESGDRNAITSWIQSALHDVDCDCEMAVPDVTLRRLNQVEYDNTIRDLLHVDLQPSKEIGFVSDDVGNGFDNQGEVLTLPPIMLEKYLQSAAYIAKHTIETDRERLRKQRFEGDPLRHGASQSIPLHLSAGQYNINVRMRFGEKQQDTCKVRIAIDDKTVAEIDVPSKDENYKYDVDVESGSHTLHVQFVEDAEPDKRNDPNRRLFVDSVRIQGPSEGLPAWPESHERLVIATPDQKDAPEGMPIGFSEASRRVFANFLPKAFRRPVSEEELQATVVICEKAHEAGFSYEESLRFGLQATLVSPNFLYRLEAPTADRAIDDYALATRLSYFLWSTTPDETLMSLAREGRLHTPEVLADQIDRMLESPRSEALVRGFFGQWLGLRNLAKLEIDRGKFVGWNDRLQAAFIRETELFCGYLLREGSIGDITQCNFTFVNPRLAEFYGVMFEGKDPAEMYRRGPGRRGNNERRQGLYDDEDKWIRVELPNNRKGLLTHASVLALTSNPTRTSPVKRGKWILEAILGDPPPSAPPSVPSLEAVELGPDASLKERLELHRSNPSCAGCHRLMDPIGLGLENFDAIGRWREQDGNATIEARGQLVDGREFSSPSQLVGLLDDKKIPMAENFATRLLTYALGRGLQRQDKCDLDRIVAHADRNAFSIRSMVHAVVMSDAFLQRSKTSAQETNP